MGGKFKDAKEAAKRYVRTMTSGAEVQSFHTIQKPQDTSSSQKDTSSLIQAIDSIKHPDSWTNLYEESFWVLINWLWKQIPVH